MASVDIDVVEVDDEQLDDGGSDLTALKKLFEEARDQSQDARDQAATDFDYYSGKQWSEAELATLKKRRQPPIVYNLVRMKVESTCGVEENSKTDPRAMPRTPKDEAAAEVATDTLRCVCDVNRFSDQRIKVLRDTMIYGAGGVMIEVSGDQEPEIKIRRLRWENVVFDPYSRESDFSDARYVGMASWMNEADVIALYGEEARPAVEGAIEDTSLSSGSDTYKDRPSNVWADRKRRRVLVVELYHREGQEWRHSVFTGAGIIMAGVSAYRDAKGKATCPIELTSCYIDKDNNRYGIVRDMRSPQDEVNHRRSKLLHLLNARQTFRKEGTIASKDPQALRRELNKPDGDIVIAKNATWGQDVGIIDTNAQASGQAELLQDAYMFMDRMGANNALLGQKTETQSGRAILAQQQAGMTTLATLFADHNDWVLRVYRQIWARARQFWTAPMYIRVTDELEAPKFIYVNEVVGFEQGPPDPQTGQYTQIPMVRNRIAEMDVDLIVDRVPHSANIQQEQFEMIANLMSEGKLPQTPETISALVASSSLRDKGKLIESFNKPPDPQIQRKANAEIMKDEADAAYSMARAKKETVEAEQIAAQTAMQAAQMQAMMAHPPMIPPEASVPAIPGPQGPPPMPMGGLPQGLPAPPLQPPGPPLPEPPQQYGEAVPVPPQPPQPIP